MVASTASINNAGVFIGKPFIDYTVADFAAGIGEPGRVLPHHSTGIRQMVEQGGGHVVNVSTSLVDHADSSRPSGLAALTKGGLVAVARSLAIEYLSRGVRGQRGHRSVLSGPPNTKRPRTREWQPFTLSGGWATSATWSTGVLYLDQATFVTGEILHIDGGQAAGH